MAVNKVVCPDCGVRIVECRRYRLEPLAEFMRMTMSAACIEVGIAGSTQKSAKCHGVTRQVADRAAAHFKEHPSAIWPEVVDHDIEDSSRICPECHESFLPHWKTQKFCTPNHQRRHNMRTRYHADAELRERRLVNKRAWYAANREALLAERRTPTGRKTNRLQQKARYQWNPEARERRKAWNREWKRQNRERLNEYMREYRARKKAEREGRAA